MKKTPKAILSQRLGWGIGLTKDREERYKENFWRKNKMHYMEKYTKEEVREKWEKKDNIELKTDFFFSEQTGPLTNFYEKYPMRLMIDNERLMTASRFKKFLYLFLQEMQFATWYEKLGILLSIRRLKNIYLEGVYRGVAEYLIDLRYITPPVREIRRCLEIALPGKGEYEWEGYYSDPPCFFIEYDPAYRYRLQDMLTEAKKDEFVDKGSRIMGIIRLFLWLITKKDRFLYRPAREIKRLVEIVISREVSRGWTWGKLPVLSAIMVQSFTSIRKKLCVFMKELDQDKIKMNIYDRYWGYQNKEYNYGGLNYQLRKKIVEQYDSSTNN